MRRWKKILLLAVVLLIAAVVVVILSIDGIAMRAVERQASAALGVETTLRTLTLGVVRGEAKMAGLDVHNPKGFDSDHFLTLKSGDVQVSVGSLLKDTVVVPTLELDDIDLILENKNGNANYTTIQTNLKGQDSQDKNTQPGKKFIVKDLLIKNVTVHADLLPFGGEATRVTLNIPELHLQNVGSDSDNGVAISELTNVVVKAIFEAIIKSGNNLLPSDIASTLGSGMSQLKGVGKMDITTVGGTIIQSGAGIGSKIGDAAKSVVDGVSGLLNGKPKKNQPKKNDDDQ